MNRVRSFAGIRASQDGWGLVELRLKLKLGKGIPDLVEVLVKKERLDLRTMGNL